MVVQVTRFIDKAVRPSYGLPQGQKNQKISFESRVKKTTTRQGSLPIPSTYGIFPYIWLILMANVSKYTSPMDAMGQK